LAKARKPVGIGFLRILQGRGQDLGDLGGEILSKVVYREQAHPR